MQRCTVWYCHAPLDPYKSQIKKCNGQIVCDVCFEMFRAVNREWFVAAQVEYEKEVRRIKKLRNGGDYLAE